MRFSLPLCLPPYIPLVLSWVVSVILCVWCVGSGGVGVCVCACDLVRLGVFLCIREKYTLYMYVDSFYLHFLLLHLSLPLARSHFPSSPSSSPSPTLRPPSPPTPQVFRYIANFSRVLMGRRTSGQTALHSTQLRYSASVEISKSTQARSINKESRDELKPLPSLLLLPLNLIAGRVMAEGWVVPGKALGAGNLIALLGSGNLCSTISELAFEI